MFNVLLALVGLAYVGGGMFLADKMRWRFNYFSTSIIAAGGVLFLLSFSFFTYGHKSLRYVLFFIWLMLLLIVADATGAGAVLYNEEAILNELNHDFNISDINFRLTNDNIRFVGFSFIIIVGLQVAAILLALSHRSHLLAIESEDTISGLREQLFRAPDVATVRMLQGQLERSASENSSLQRRLSLRDQNTETTIRNDVASEVDDDADAGSDDDGPTTAIAVQVVEDEGTPHSRIRKAAAAVVQVAEEIDIVGSKVPTIVSDDESLTGGEEKRTEVVPVEGSEDSGGDKKMTED